MDCKDTAERVKTKTKATHETCNHIIYFDLIGVKTKFTLQVFSINGGNPRRKDQILLKGIGNQACARKGGLSRESMGPAACC